MSPLVDLKKPLRARAARRIYGRTALTIAVVWAAGAAISVASQWSLADAPAPAAAKSREVTHSDASHSEVGLASFYAKRYAGRTMADGTRMRPDSNNAASLSLPLGSTARVTNLENHLTAVVTIRDRGPYVAGRIIDLAPSTARQIGLSERQGLARVQVTPLSRPRGG